MEPLDNRVPEVQVVVEAMRPRLVTLHYEDRITKREFLVRLQELNGIVDRWFSLLVVSVELPVLALFIMYDTARLDGEADYADGASRQCHFELEATCNLNILLEFCRGRIIKMFR